MEISLKNKAKQNKSKQTKAKTKLPKKRKGQKQKERESPYILFLLPSPPYIYTQAKIWFLLFMRVFPTVKKDNFFFFFFFL